MTKTLKEAKRLHALGFGILLLHQKSKRPKDNGWTTGKRKDWDTLERQYSEGDNIGVVCGSQSIIGDKYLACIDVDIKDKAYRAEAEAKLKELIGTRNLPTVSSGSGQGSRHLYCVTQRPFKMITVVKVKDAYEICVYSNGRQMVLPPSIHPNGKPYQWARPVVNEGSFPIFENEYFESFRIVDKSVDKPGSITSVEKIDLDVFAPVDLMTLNVSDKIVDMILSGKDVKDRSSALLPVATALLKSGLSPNQILSVLTDPNYFLGECAYDHAKTSSRKRAAEWVMKYTLKKVLDEHSAEALFREPIAETRELSESEIAENENEVAALKHWTEDLDLTEKGLYRTTLNNVVKILHNAVSKNFIRRDLFLNRDAYFQDTPWGGTASKSITDDDMISIKYWFSQNWGFEPSAFLISEAISQIAIENAFDPVVDYINGLPKWDGIERLGTWLVDHFGAKINDKPGCADYYGQVFTKWIVGMVMRGLKPGANMPWMPIFEGAQGVGKSSFGRILVGEKYFVDWLPDLGEKDSAIALQGAWAAEMGELSNLRKTEIEVVKAYVSRKIDKYRPPHGRRTIEVERRCVFFGTTNSATYLKDDSGNRRFKPLEIGQLDFDQLAKDREQLFAEALWLYKMGFESESTMTLTGEALAYEHAIQATKMVEDEADLMAEEITKFYEKIQAKKDGEKTFNFGHFSISELYMVPVSGAYLPPLQKWDYNGRNVQFTSKALKALGAKSHRTKSKRFWEWGKNGG